MNIKIIYIIGSILVMMLIYFIFSGSSMRRENRLINKEINDIKKQRDKLMDSIGILQKSYIDLEKEVVKKENSLVEIDKKIDKIQRDVYNSIKQLLNIRNSVDSINKQIDRLEPVNRTGDSLLESLKNKIK